MSTAMRISLSDRALDEKFEKIQSLAWTGTELAISNAITLIPSMLPITKTPSYMVFCLEYLHGALNALEDDRQKAWESLIVMKRELGL